VIAYRNGDHIFIFNFHPTESYPTFELPVHENASFQVVMDTDEWRFGGQGRIYHDPVYRTQPLPMNRDYLGILIYIPCRTALVMKKSIETKSTCPICAESIRNPDLTSTYARFPVENRW